jgi:hypothetical protein
MKYILFWNEAYGSNNRFSNKSNNGFCCGQKPFLNCPVKDCVVTDDRKYLNNVDHFDAIQFHQRSMDRNDLPQNRSSHQRYIMWYMESASYPFGFHR